MTSVVLTRRAGLQAAIAGLGLTLGPGALWAKTTTATPPDDAVLNSVCDLVIPATTTPGALAAGVPAFVRLAQAHADGIASTGHEWSQLAALLNARHYLRGDDSARLRLLEQLDAAAFTPGASSRAAPWLIVKSLIIVGYYTSQIGGSQELRYDLVPGRFDADIPVDPHLAEYSNDWIAVDFR